MTTTNRFDLTFPEFVVMWHQGQGMTTPRVQIKMARWLDRRTRKDDQQLLLMAFRGAGKSTLTALYAAWTLYRAPATRILVVAAHDHLATRMVRHVRRILEQHLVTKHLCPSDPDQWAADRFTINRPIELADPSMIARGITSNITGLRADLIICDDVEVPNTADTSDKRADLRARLHELSFVQTPHGRTLYIGTPHVFDTIYATKPRADLPGHIPHLSGFSLLQIPVLDRRGASAWPEKFSLDFLTRQRAAVGENFFQSQMMLSPTNITALRLDPAQLLVYDDNLMPVPERGSLYIGDQQMASCSAWWDPSQGMPVCLRFCLPTRVGICGCIIWNIWIYLRVVIKRGRNAMPWRPFCIAIMCRWWGLKPMGWGPFCLASCARRLCRRGRRPRYAPCTKIPARPIVF